jgi:hypothetical protein
MNELVEQLTAKVGLDRGVAENTIGIILGFLRREGPADTVQALIDEIPGAQAAIDASGTGRVLGMDEIKSVARELFKFGRDKIGADQMGAIIAGTPGLSQFA